MWKPGRTIWYDEGLALSLAVIALFPTAIMVQALRSPTVGELGYDPNNYWGLTIYLHPPQGADRVFVEVTGPFGHQQSQTFSAVVPYNPPVYNFSSRSLTEGWLVLGVPYAVLSLTK